jgi:hypothetical protein
MEKANREKIKEIFLSAFVLVCVGLIFALWVNAFSEKDVETPYFYRGVPELSESFDATRTAQSILENRTATPVSTASQSTATPIPIPTITPDLLLNFTPESDE